MLLSTIVPYLVLAATGLAAVIPETNGDRLRRGLTPKQPARRWDASRTHWHHARASGSPSATAYLEALDSNSNPIGYLYKVNGTYGLTTGDPVGADLLSISSDYTDMYNTIKDGSTWVSIKTAYTPSILAKIADGTNFGMLSYESDGTDGGQASAADYLATNDYETSVWPIPDGVFGGPAFRPSFTDTDGTTSIPRAYYNAQKSTQIFVAASHGDIPGLGFSTSDRIRFQWVSSAPIISPP